MYQTIIRDSGGEGLIRVVSVPCGPGRAVVNGSLLIVPPGTVAYAAVNGMLSPPYGPGRHELFTGVDPFFVRLRHLMTRGDAGVTVSVFFLSTEKHCFLQLGTGELPLRERRFQITLKAFAACGLAVSIDDPLRVLQRLVGSYSTGFSEEDLEPCLQQLMLAPVREALSQELSRFDVTQMNSQLQRLSERVSPPVRAAFADYGLWLERLQVMAVNIPDGEIQRLYELEQNYAAGKSRTDLELDQIKRVWDGNVDRRTIAEMLRGGGGGSGGAPMLQMMAMMQMMPALREQMQSMLQRSGPADGSGTNRTPPPPMPPRTRRCPDCGAALERDAHTCPHCGRRF